MDNEVQAKGKNGTDNFSCVSKFWKFFTTIVMFFCYILWPFLLFLIPNCLQAIFPVSLGMACFLSVLLYLVGIGIWFIVVFSQTLMSHMLLLALQNTDKSRIEGQKKGIDNFVALKQVRDSECEKKKRPQLCPLKIGINESKIVPKIDNESFKRIYDQDYAYRTEQTDRWHNIWIFSEDLSSFCTDLDNKDSRKAIFCYNVANRQVRYTFFYINIKRDIDRTNRIVQNQNKILNQLESNQARERIIFSPIDAKRGYLGRNVLPFLCGSILFSIEEGIPTSFEGGYLLIRGKTNGDPIYYKMPNCMLSRYVDFFKKVEDSNSPKRDRNSANGS